MLYLRSAWAHNEKLYSTSKWADFKPYGTCRKCRDEVSEILGKIQSEIRFTSSNRDFVSICKSKESLHVVNIIEGNLCYTMLDSGSTKSLLSENVFKKMPLRSLVPAKQSLITASGNLMDVIAETELEISIGDLQSSQKFIVFSSLITDCILGVDFLACHKVQLNFAKQIIIGPVIGELAKAEKSRGSSKSSCPVHR